MTRRPQRWAAPAILAHSESDTLGPTTLSRFASFPKVVPEREAPSMPSATSASPGTCMQSGSTPAPAQRRANLSEPACIGGELELPLRRAEMAASASFRKKPRRPSSRGCRSCSAASSARGAARSSRCACSPTADPAGHVPMNKCSHSSRRPRTVSHQRRSAAQPRVDASQVNAKATASGMPPSRKTRYPEDGTSGHSGLPAPWYFVITALSSAARSTIAAVTGKGVSYWLSSTAPTRQRISVASTRVWLMHAE